MMLGWYRVSATNAQYWTLLAQWAAMDGTGPDVWRFRLPPGWRYSEGQG